MSVRPADNPFRVQRLDALEYRFAEGSWGELRARLDVLGGRGAIVGPKGAGKSTLLRGLAQRLAAEGLRVVWLRAWPDRARPRLAELPLLGRGDALLVDGLGHFSWTGWRRLARSARNASVVVSTQHRVGRLPLLARCETTIELLTDLVHRLAGPRERPGASELETLFASTGGNLREALLALYDARGRATLTAGSLH